MKVAFIGAVGVPGNYGGFETFVDSCTPTLAKTFDKVIVTCDRSRYDTHEPQWNGVHRIFIPVRANGAWSVIHDFLAFFAVFWRVETIVVLGVSAGIFFPLFRMACAPFSKRLIVNVDGIEWRREKFSPLKRAFLFVCDRFAQLFAHTVIIDNEALRPYLIRSVQHRAQLIAYPGDHVARVEGGNTADSLERRCLTICRIEPENNCHILLEAFVRAKRGKYIFVGNWDASTYGRDLKARYKDSPGLDLRDPTYDKFELALLRESCNLYLHGHSVGGTNPSLVEMLFYDCTILAFDCAFNRHAGGAALQYFSNQDELAAYIATSNDPVRDDLTRDARLAARSLYTIDRISDSYAELARGVSAAGKPAYCPAQDAVSEKP